MPTPNEPLPGLPAGSLDGAGRAKSRTVQQRADQWIWWTYDRLCSAHRDLRRTTSRVQPLYLPLPRAGQAVL